MIDPAESAGSSQFHGCEAAHSAVPLGPFLSYSAPASNPPPSGVATEAVCTNAEDLCRPASPGSFTRNYFKKPQIHKSRATVLLTLPTTSSVPGRWHLLGAGGRPKSLRRRCSGERKQPRAVLAGHRASWLAVNESADGQLGNQKAV